MSRVTNNVLRGFIFISLFFLTGLVNGQKIDSLYRVLKTEGDDTSKVKTLNKLSRLLYIRSEYTKSDSLERIALALAHNLKYGRGEADANIGIGSIYYRQGNYADALKYQLQALSIAEKIKYKKGMAGALTNIGNIYDDQNNHDLALEYYMKSLKIYEELNDKVDMSSDYGNIGLVYMSEDKYNEALAYQQKALMLDKELNDERGMGFDYGNIGITYEAMGDYKNAETNYRLNLTLAQKQNDKQSMAYAYEKLLSVLARQKKFDLAKKYADSCLWAAKQVDGKNLIKAAYYDMYRMDSIQNNFKTTYNDYRMYVVYSDSLTNEENTKKLVSEQMQYEFDKKQGEEKAVQDKKDAENKAAEKRQEIVSGAIGIGLLLVIIFSGLLYSRFKITEKQKKIIEEQKEIVEEKNKEVLDSITYAKRLQDAILPPISIIQKHLPESFVLYKPKDIVAGDFYWMEKAGDTIFIAAADCTGHGVPGAMVSVVCSNALNRAVKEFKITEPGKILDKVRELVLETFEKSEGDIKDGMDISLLAINAPIAIRAASIISWAGAYNSLWYLENKEMKEIAADKQPIGKHDVQKPFSTHSLNLKNGDILYLFTDGYADQFGGPKGKKFKYKQLQEKLLAMAAQSMDKQKEMLAETLDNWKGNLEQVDDILIIGIRV